MTERSRTTQRLEAFNYASHGAYFITICAQTRGADWFGKVTGDGMNLNAAGEMVLEVWNDLPKFYRGVQIDAFVVMPDHIHGIVILQPVDPQNPTDVGAGPRARPGQMDANAKAGQTQGSAPTISNTLSLPDVVQRFKSLTTGRYIRGVCESVWPSFEKRFWQRNSWDRIVRDARELEATRTYIAQNPLRQLLEKGGVE
jgi:putative transposase